MTFQATVVRVLLASPGDFQESRAETDQPAKQATLRSPGINPGAEVGLGEAVVGCTLAGG